jgi:hypothetical protein
VSRIDKTRLNLADTLFRRVALSSPKNRSTLLRSADFRCSVASHFNSAGRQRSLPILTGIRVVACDSARTHVTWRAVQLGNLGLCSIVALKMSMHLQRAFDDTSRGLR